MVHLVLHAYSRAKSQRKRRNRPFETYTTVLFSGMRTGLITSSRLVAVAVGVGGACLADGAGAAWIRNGVCLLGDSKLMIGFR